ncbi:uncharacterized protein G2W53_037049 [Senna tora]|uniref:Uncharacterized protein n=1 Tax=Senna tora TaxID=362788 RepID=A0A834W988_9FABA|nr:uncharacterized protein G2W53_037049 [Senna tora]
MARKFQVICMKQDIHKAYDKFSWSFIEERGSRKIVEGHQN